MQQIELVMDHSLREEWWASKERIGSITQMRAIGWIEPLELPYLLRILPAGHLIYLGNGYGDAAADEQALRIEKLRAQGLSGAELEPYFGKLLESPFALSLESMRNLLRQSREQLIWFYNTRHFSVVNRKISRPERRRIKAKHDYIAEVCYTITVQHSGTRSEPRGTNERRPLDYAVMKMRHRRTFSSERFTNVRGTSIVIEPHPTKYGVPIVEKVRRFVSGEACTNQGRRAGSL